MKSKSFNLAVILLLCAVIGPAAFFLGRSTGQRTAGPKTLYTCGMHPTVIRDAPGNCPICGMKLTPIRNQDAPAASTASTAITIDPATAQNMNLRTAVLTNGPLRRIVRSVGIVDFNEASLADITTRFQGWIEELHVDTTGTLIRRGDPLFDITSPELYSAQTDYLLALQQGAGGSQMLKSSALTRLQFFGVSPEQIAELERSRQARQTLTVTASRDGIVLEKMAVQGQMVDAGMRLYRIADLSVVWVVVQVFEQDLPFVKPGQEAMVHLSYFPDQEFPGKVAYVYPTLDEQTRTARVRIELENPGHFLKPGMFATVSLRAELQSSALLVPDMAVLRSGDRDTVFVALDGGRFEARSVTLGRRSEDNQYQVLSGLSPGERVVISGQFMLDSESQLREAILKLEGPPREPAASNAPSATPQTEPAAGLRLYACPMHPEVVSDKPGVCPKCEMNLVPIAELDQGKAAIAEETWRKQQATNPPAIHQH